jgi:hypothetical protein
LRNKTAPPKWSKGWRDLPQPYDYFGAYTTEQLERMNQEFTAAVERAFRLIAKQTNLRRCPDSEFSVVI